MQIWILGTSDDINKLDENWYKDKITIGINTAYRKAKDRLTHWLCFDQCFMFYDWLRNNEAPNTQKWIFNDYRSDDRLNIFLPPPRARKRDFVDPNAAFAKNIVHFYLVHPFINSMDPYIQLDRNEAYENMMGRPGSGMSVLDADRYTLITAISLAIGLGATEIRLRGVGFQGGYFDDKDQCNLDNVYEEQARIIGRKVLPALQKRGIRLYNDTASARFIFRDYKLQEIC